MDRDVGNPKSVMPKGRPPGSRNKPKDNPKPRKPYTSTKRKSCVVKENLLEKFRREVTEQAIAVIPCEQFESWLASFAAHEGNDYVRKDQHVHTYNSTHYRVVTYGCNHMESHKVFKPIPATEEDNGTDVQFSASQGKGIVEGLLRESEGKADGESYEMIGCDAILDIYYFYESTQYQIVQLGEHEHDPTNLPQHIFGVVPGLAPLKESEQMMSIL